MSMKAGKYFIGDLCYVMHDEWDEVCDLLFAGRNDHGCNEGEFTLKDGRRFAMWNTAYGDGCYPVTGGFTVGVDSGSVGCILLDDIKDIPDNRPLLGCVVEFDTDFVTSSDGSTISFGEIEVLTGSFDDEEEEEEEEWYDEEEEDNV